MTNILLTVGMLLAIYFWFLLFVWCTVAFNIVLLKIQNGMVTSLIMWYIVNAFDDDAISCLFTIVENIV